MHTWIDTLCKLLAEDEQVCLVTVVNIRGSAPREAGARMVVTETETRGTIGGGQLEYQCARLAVEQLASATDDTFSHSLRTFTLGSNCGQCCGGTVDVLTERLSKTDLRWLLELQRIYNEGRTCTVVSSAHKGRAIFAADQVSNFGLPESQLQSAAAIENEMRGCYEESSWSKVAGDGLFMQRIASSDFNIAVFGAGHVGSATVGILAALDCRIQWIDSRSNVFHGDLPENVITKVTDEPAAEVAALPPRSFFLVMTHSHAIDLDICDQILRRQDAAYCGLIGSLSKRRRFERQLRKLGLAEKALVNLVCPIGVQGIPGKQPQEIAVAAAAELLQIRASSARVPLSQPVGKVHVI